MHMDKTATIEPSATIAVQLVDAVLKLYIFDEEESLETREMYNRLEKGVTVRISVETARISFKHSSLYQRPRD